MGVKIPKADQREDRAKNMLDLVTASSIAAPFFRIFLEVGIFGQNHLTMKLAADVSSRLGLQMLVFYLYNS
jgi:hypothetical protein